MTKRDDKIALIMLGMGGPDRLENIGEFLFNIFSDRSIIRLPGGSLFQKPLARLISLMRRKKVQAHYDLIGGSSPLLKWTKAQQDNIDFIMVPIFTSFKSFIGMRYFKPTIETAIDKAYADGFRRFCVLPMYPQYCKATTGSSFMEVKRSAGKYNDVEIGFINDFHDNPAYISLLKKYINANIQNDETLLFSAHSVPQKFFDEGDPYVGQTKKTAALAAGDREYFLSFQSRTGPVKWVGPDTVETVARLIESGKKLFVVPISFVCDHIETLYELDIELEQMVGKSAKGKIRRMPMFNDDREFGSLLAEIIMERYYGK